MGGSRKWLGRACLIGATAVLGGVGAPTALAAGARARVGSVAPRPAHARVAGRLPVTGRLRLTVELASRDPLALAALARAVTTPGSAQYGHFLSVGEFAQRFGAPASDIARVADALRRDGLRVGAPSRNGLQVSVSGTVGAVERAFAVSEHSLRLAGGRHAYANAQAPTLPVAIAGGVQAVLGLDDLTPERPGGLTRAPRRAPARGRSHATADVADNGGPQPCAAASSVYDDGADALTADGIATAYGFQSLYGAGDFGQGQTVALVEFEGFDPIDIAAYQSCYGTDAQVSATDVDGGPAPTSDDAEPALDIEQVIGLAPQANIQVYQAPADDTTAAVLDAIVSADSAQVISESWGACEDFLPVSEMDAENTLLQEAAVQGQSFFASTGDYGSAGCSQADPSDTSLSLQDPSSQPYATAVGGTFLYSSTDDGSFPYGAGSWYSAGAPVAQAVWNDTGATGGGPSSIWAMPAYQSAAAPSLGVLSGLVYGAPCGSASGCREAPDVSADASPDSGYAMYFDGSRYNGGWQAIGGTSAAAPLWAAFTALADSSASCDSLTLGFLNPALYSIAGSAYGADFSDISAIDPLTGADSNDGYSVSGSDPNGDLYPVTTSYDMATGLGSMIAGPLAQSLCTARHTFMVSVASPGAPTGTVGAPLSVGLSATDSGGAALGYSASGLPAGLSINPADGVISGVPTTPGAAAVTVSAADAYGNSGAAQFTIDIAPRPTVKSIVVTGRRHAGTRPSARRVTLSGLVRRRPSLAFALSAGRGRLIAFRVIVPTGFAVSRRLRALDAGLAVRAGARRARFKATVVGGVLEVRLRRAERSVRVTLTRPGLTITRREAHRIRRHAIRRVVLVITTLDSNHIRRRQRIAVRRLS